MAKPPTSKKRPTVADNTKQISRLATAHNRVVEELRELRKEQNEGLLKLLSRVIQERPEAPPDDLSPMNVVKLEDLARTLLLSRERCDAAIAQARRRYHDVLRDMRETNEHAAQSDGLREVFLKILNRYKIYYQQDLELLGVTISEVSQGVPIDPNYHEVVEKHPTNSKKEFDTVAVARTPLMTWNDASNTQQLQAAQVVAFVQENASTPNSAIDFRHRKEGNRNGLFN